MKQAILFDLDGTLVDTLEDICDAMNRSLRLHHLPEWDLPDYRYLVGNGAKILAQRAVRDRQDLAESVQAEYQFWYERHDMDKSHAYDGMPETLRQIGRAHV